MGSEIPKERKLGKESVLTGREGEREEREEEERKEEKGEEKEGRVWM